jgi:hypothetical protein
MSYAEPKILEIGNATSIVRQVDSTTTYGKVCDVFLDFADVFPHPCTLLAYEGDE